jgi:Protein of unknown function (DUF2924)
VTFVNERNLTFKCSATALLVREWNGHLERIMILDDGYAWNGCVYRSLSQVAKAITGTNWNGHRFFGLKAVRTGTVEVGDPPVPRSGGRGGPPHSPSKDGRPFGRPTGRWRGPLLQNVAPRSRPWTKHSIGLIRCTSFVLLHVDISW